MNQQKNTLSRIAELAGINPTLLESSLTRVWQHHQNPDTSYAILTAFRGEYQFDENTQRNKSLAAEIRNKGYGFFYLDGYWVENQGTPDEVKVKEDSLFVIGKSSDSDFAANLHSLGNKYDQEAIVVKDKDGTRLIFKDGSVVELGDLKPGGIGTIYSKIRGGDGKTFIFENERIDGGWSSRLFQLKS